MTRGGWLDVALGVISGLEVPRTLGGGIDVISFQDEEGAFLPCLSSRTFIGDMTQAEIDAARARDGRTLTTALAQAALGGTPLTGGGEPSQRARGPQQEPDRLRKVGAPMARSQVGTQEGNG